MESIIDALRSTARHIEPLLDILSQTEYAVSALEQQKRRVNELDSRLRIAKNRIRILGNQKEKERRDFKEYHDSVIERWLYKITGNEARFEATVDKGRIRYAHALGLLYHAKMSEQELMKRRAEALMAQHRLERDYARYAPARREFDTLYASIFQGATSPSPEIDDAERHVERALQTYKHSRTKLKADQEVERILQETNGWMRSSLSGIEAALNGFRLIVISANGNHMRRHLLLRVIVDVSRAQKNISRAQQISPEVKALPAINISRELRIGSKQIRDSHREVERYKQALEAQLKAARRRSCISEQQLVLDSELLEAARRELQKERQRLFRRLAGDGLYYEPPPQYSC